MGQLLGVVVVGFKGEGLFPVEGQNLGKGSCVVPWENFTITESTTQEEQVNDGTFSKTESHNLHGMHQVGLGSGS